MFLTGKEDSTLGVTLQRGDDLEKSPKWLDSIVLRSGTLPGMTTYSGTYDQGGVLVHEVYTEILGAHGALPEPHPRHPSIPLYRSAIG